MSHKKFIGAVNWATYPPSWDRDTRLCAITLSLMAGVGLNAVFKTAIPFFIIVGLLIVGYVALTTWNMVTAIWGPFDDRKERDLKEDLAGSHENIRKLTEELKTLQDHYRVVYDRMVEAEAEAPSLEDDLAELTDNWNKLLAWTKTIEDEDMREAMQAQINREFREASAELIRQSAMI